ncbi:hypothetical protein [Curtobacterium sp. MCSS17_016]|uniref:hypothetical protein n=1 Tax=Curtobacterium sp. MCSS17_016 TaxID=2175644 RepID=UPI0011B5FD3D|nr:hypothetical protein [Curtobacterium sp. MCSS17_016]WIE81076.1 hypothetical protein DEJ19_021560 [Curtobacterium sp. MCSS17_016]
MTTFVETDHPRAAGDGRFTEKTFAAPTVGLNAHGVSTDGLAPVDVATAEDGDRAVFRISAGDDDHYAYDGTFITDTDGVSAIVRLDGKDEELVLIGGERGTWFTENGRRVTAFTPF